MLSNREIFALLFIILVAITNISLVNLGESRPDVYVILSILYYFVLKVFFEPVKNKKIIYLDAFLILVFILIVAYRVQEILQGLR